jgi:hypothetical protein
MKIRTFSILIFCLIAIYPSQASEFFDRVTGNFELSKAKGTPKLGLNRHKTKNCPQNIEIRFNELQASLELKNRRSGEVIEIFPSINQRKRIKKVDTMIWKETKTTLSRRVLTKRSRICKGAISRNCEGNYKPRTSLLSSKEDLVFNIYGKNHRLQAKCFYQRPNEIGL